jgi:uncharacterized UPF0160 family protein
MLVAGWLVTSGIMPTHHYSWMLPLFRKLSDIDTGTVKAEPDSIALMIKALNGVSINPDKDFRVAVQLARGYCTNLKINADRSQEDRKRWDELQTFHTNFGKWKVQEEGDVILTWKSLAEEQGYLGLICPNNRVQGQWNLISRDSAAWIVPAIPAEEGQVFRHSSGFMAVYDSFESLTNHISQLNWPVLLAN